MKKCEWKDGKLEACDGFNPSILQTVPSGDYIPACKSCGADIRRHDLGSTEVVKPEPAEPSHPDIMTKWWNRNEKWVKVYMYTDYGWYSVNGKQSSVQKDWFIGRQSATIPPESV